MAATPSQAPPTGCPPAGFTQLDGGHIRMPAGAKPGATRLLLAIMSGADGDADDNLKLGAAANHQGIAVLYPTERAGSIWQLNDAMGVTDVEGVTALLQRALATGCFDPERVSVVGLSNGAGFATRMACELPTQFAAVVSVAGGYRALDPCPPATQASFLAIHGTADTIVPFNGKKPDRKGNVTRYAAGWPPATDAPRRRRRSARATSSPAWCSRAARRPARRGPAPLGHGSRLARRAPAVAAAQPLRGRREPRDHALDPAGREALTDGGRRPRPNRRGRVGRAVASVPH